MKAIINGRIITEEKVLENKILVFNERILEFKKQKDWEHMAENFRCTYGGTFYK